MQIQRQSFVQEQRLKMNPQLYQSLKLMELPVAELREKINEELERNPALELIEDKSTVLLNREETEFLIKERAQKTRHSPTSPNYGKNSGEAASEEHRRFIENALTRPETLQEHLLWQLQLEKVDEQVRKTAETLIQNLDDDGFHKEKAESLFPEGQPDCLSEAMELVRSLEPNGCCTSGYRESLEAQIRLSQNAPLYLFENGRTAKVLDNLELVEKEKYGALAKILKLEEGQVSLICEFLKTLYPFPGRSFAPADVRYVIPDIKVIREKDEFAIILNDEAFPVLGVNKFYKKLTGAEKTDKKSSRHKADSASQTDKQTQARDFAREKTREAMIFIDHLNRRNQTLIRVSKAILEFQRSFFINGPKYLAPLTLKDIARELDIHETTVSRTANGKYMQTEWGIFEIRYFFTNSISGTGSKGSKFSKESVKQMIKEIIESGGGKLSDQDISAVLGKKGIALARRTVAKYRKELDMGSSYSRKVKH